MGKFQFIKMDLNKIIFLMMLCVPMFVGAQTLTFTDHEPPPPSSVPQAS